MDIKNTKLNFLKDKRVKFSLEFDSKIRYIYGSGIYIFYSPSENLAYIGQSKNIYDRLMSHIRATFLEYAHNDTNSYKVLGLDDVEMYCCFTEDVYDYDGVSNISKELATLESYVIDIFLNSGIQLVNHIITKYDINDLESYSFENLGASIDLEYDFFSLGLRDRLIEKYCYSDISHRLEVSYLNKQLESRSRIIDASRDENHSLKKEVNDLRNRVEIYQSLLEQSKVESDNESKYKELYMKQSKLIEDYNLRVKDKLLKMNNLLNLSSSDEIDDFIKASKKVKGYKTLMRSIELINDYISSVDSVDDTLISSISALVRKRSELTLMYLFQYRTGFSEKIKNDVLSNFLDAIESENVNFLYAFKLNWKIIYEKELFEDGCDKGEA